MVAISRSGDDFLDPRKLHRQIITATVLNNVTGGVSAAGSGGAGFFTEQAKRGIADDTNWTADTYKTLVTVASGSGLVSHIIGPTGLAGTPTTTIEITIDGVLYTIAVVATTTGQRALLGPVLSNSSLFTSVDIAAAGSDGINAGKDTDLITSGAVRVPPWQFIRLFGTPCLEFRTSLLIRMKSSESNSTTTNQERQSAVQYRTFS